VQVRGFAPTEMGSTMSVLGLAGCVGGLGLPMLSDRIGRRAVLVLAMILATLVPLAALFWVGANWVLSLLLFCGSLSVGALPIFAVVVPGESVPAAKVASTIALIVGTGEIIGGVGSPLLAGKLADHFGLATPFWLTLAAAAICFLLSLAIKTGSANRPAAAPLKAAPAGSAT
jgi:MFS family permease